MAPPLDTIPISPSPAPDTYSPTITDVRPLSPLSSTSIRDLIRAGLSHPPGKRSLPTVLLYDEAGLRIYDSLTAHCDVYYPFPEEEGILKRSAADIVRRMGLDNGEGGVMVELGAGALRKTSLLLRALAALAPASSASGSPAPAAPYTYYALDLDHNELDRSLKLLMTTYGAELNGKVDARGMWGTYEGGIEFVRAGGLARDRDAQMQTETGALLPAEAQTGKLCADALEARGRKAERVVDLDVDAPERQGTTESSTVRSSTPPLSNASSVPSESEASTPPGATPAPQPAQLAGEGDDEANADHPPLHLLFLGSSLGNLTRDAAAPFLAGLPLRPGSRDTLLLGLDGRNEEWRVQAAYSQEDYWTNEFIMNGLVNAAREMGDGAGSGAGSFDREKWEYLGRYNEEEGRHEAFYRCRAEQGIEIVIPPESSDEQEVAVSVGAGEHINIEYSYKYSSADVAALFSASNLRVIESYHSPNVNTETGEPLYTLYLLERPVCHFPLLSSLSPAASTHVFNPDNDSSSSRSTSSPNAQTLAADEFESMLLKRRPTGGVPTLEEWSELWKAWDSVTVGMIPETMMHRKPIDLRHKCLFYLGHIPAFLDIHLSRLFQEPHTEPDYFKDIFERGIDPNVDDPTQIHDHSIVPEKDEDWPALDQILAFRDAVRMRVAQLYEQMENGEKECMRRVGRILAMVFEHEAMHLETLLYMLIQVSGEPGGSLPPPGFAEPPFADLAKDSAAFPPPSNPVPTLLIKAGTIGVGHNDVEAEDMLVSANDDWKETHEFGWDNESPERKVSHGDVRIEVRPVTNGEYRAWWDKQTGRALPASWVIVDGVIQVRTLYGPIDFSYAESWPAQTAYDDISAYARSKGGRLPTETELRAFLDLTDAGAMANVGFKNWHPVPPYWNAKEEKGHNGGVWEWTSTLMDAYEGFVPSEVYPGYSNDFNDGQHHVVLGGSFATHPRIAQRRTFRNFWQHNYPYAWVGARIAYDTDASNMQ